MTVTTRRIGLYSWLLRAILLLQVVSNVTAAEKDDGKNVQTVQQRLTLASHLIQRMQGEEKAVLGAELEVFQTRFLEQIDEKLVEDSNSFFQRVVSTYRKLTPMRGEIDNGDRKSVV